MKEIKLGDKVRCKVTGFVGTAVARTHFLNGCVQYEVTPRVGKDGKIPESIYIDQQSLEVVEKKKVKIKKTKNGGPMRKSIFMSGH